MSQNRFKLGFIAAAVDAPGASDAQLYEALLSDVDFHHALGYEAAWMIEHHFSDYFPTPNPLLGLSHIAGRYPDLELGTAVLVIPWYHPLRLAEDIAMLSRISSRALHLGLGRGTAKYEYDAFGLDMGEARGRFRETLDILRLALTGDRFVYSGEHLRTPIELRVRPEPRRELINLYGAIGSPSSATIMGELGVPPICTSIGDFEKQRSAIETWRAAAAAEGHEVDDVTLPLMINCIVADSDREAIAIARQEIPRFMQAQIDHYAFDKTDWTSIKGYEQWAAAVENFKRLTLPDNIDTWTRHQLVGSVETITHRIEALLDIGFNHLILQTATPGVPVALRREWATRFIEEVVPAVDTYRLPVGS